MEKGNVKGSTVTTHAVSKNFGDVNVLKNVSLDIKKGEFFSLLGPSGCGKTTLLRIIAGFEDPTTGDIKLDGESVLSLPSNKRHVNTVFQSYALFPHLSVYENVAFPLRLKKLPEGNIKNRVEEYLRLVKLEAWKTKMPAQLSGGQKQRVAIARALINEPSVLLLDEPLSALDAKLRQHMLIELDAIHDAIGITFLYVTHDQEEAISVSDRLAVMNEGNVLQVGTPAEIYETPAHPFVAGFIGETNFFQGAIVSLSGDLAAIDAPPFGRIIATNRMSAKKGDHCILTVRPEKIRISKNEPQQENSRRNCLVGEVKEIIYSGFQSVYFVTINGADALRVSRQHINYSNDERSISFYDRVYVWWEASDGFIVEVNRS
jgi:spermidine/putrescine transport system ATP-binding protein